MGDEAKAPEKPVGELYVPRTEPTMRDAHGEVQGWLWMVEGFEARSRELGQIEAAEQWAFRAKALARAEKLLAITVLHEQAVTSAVANIIRNSRQADKIP